MTAAPGNRIFPPEIFNVLSGLPKNSNTRRALHKTCRAGRMCVKPPVNYQALLNAIHARGLNMGLDFLAAIPNNNAFNDPPPIPPSINKWRQGKINLNTVKMLFNKSEWRNFDPTFRHPGQPPRLRTSFELANLLIQQDLARLPQNRYILNNGKASQRLKNLSILR